MINFDGLKVSTLMLKVSTLMLKVMRLVLRATMMESYVGGCVSGSTSESLR